QADGRRKAPGSGVRIFILAHESYWLMSGINAAKNTDNKNQLHNPLLFQPYIDSCTFNSQTKIAKHIKQLTIRSNQ
ncbi:MAG: hypothetical protein ACN6NZ_06860, partial [Burkholderiales bacterium]